MKVLDLVFDKEEERTLWASDDATITSLESGGEPQVLEVLSDDIYQEALWRGRDLLLRGMHSLKLWHPERGMTTLVEGLARIPCRQTLAFHPDGGYFYLKSDQIGACICGHRRHLYSVNSPIEQLKIENQGSYVGLLSEHGIDVFMTFTGESMGHMGDIIGDWLLYDGLLICQVDNPRGEGLMVVDLREGRLLQGGPSGFRAFEKLLLSHSGEWMFGVSPAQELVVGFYMNEGWNPVVRWETPVKGLKEAMVIDQDRILAFQAKGSTQVIAHDGSIVRTLPLHFQGRCPRILEPNVVGAIDGRGIRRWSLANGEGVAYGCE